jgi:DtxR family Mn-dependent transcriptional regulator
MYLRAVLELHDAGVSPRRARLVERLKVSAPAVSEMVARLAQQGYLVLDEDKVLHLTRRGQLIASDVVRRH